MLTFSDLCSRLKNVKKSNGSTATAQCPAHEDKINSLSITEKDNRLLLFCHAGCKFEDLCDALKIDSSELYNQPPSPQYKSDEIERIYDYKDEKGTLLFQVVRKKGKRFYNRKPLPEGGCENNLVGVRRVLYGLPKLVMAKSNTERKSEFVYICEGEKDVEALETRGCIATCNPHGAGKWRDEYSASLTGFHCVILPDNDEPGRRHSLNIANSIYGKAASVRIVELKNLPDKGDISDWFNSGHTAQELNQIIRDTSEWKPVDTTQIQAKRSGFLFTTIDKLLKEPAEERSYVWQDILPVGGFSILSAKPKVGKSTTARNEAVCVSMGKPFLGRETLRGKVLYLCLEEKREEVKKHFSAMGANGENILIHTGATPDNALFELTLAIKEHSPILVIVDPLSRLLRVRDFNDYATMTRGLEPFIDIARKYETHIQALHHDNKGERSGGDALLGSTALFGSVDCHIQMKRRENARTISTINRYGEDLPETVIELNKETGIISVMGSLQDVLQTQKENEILEIIDLEEVITEQAIKERISGSNGIIAKALRTLLNERKIFRGGKGGKGNPYVYSKYPNDENLQNTLGFDDF